MTLRSVGSLLCLFCLLLAPSARAGSWPQGEITLKTRDGKQRVGQILSETGVGYLFRTATETLVIPFGDIDSMGAGEKENAPVSNATRPAVAVPSYARQASETPPDDEPWLERRRGFHFGLGGAAGGMAVPAGRFRSGLISWAMLGARMPLEWGFNRAGLRVMPLLGVVRADAGNSFDNPEMAGLFGGDIQIRLYVSRALSFGIGVFQAVTFGAGAAYSVGPSLSVFNYRFGRTLSHSIEVWGCVNFSPTASGAALSLPLVTVGYSYMW